MARLADAIRAHLLSDPTISGAVGGTRYYPSMRTQGSALPAIVAEIDDEPLHDLTADSGSGFATVYLVCLATTEAAVADLAAAVRARVNGATSVLSLGERFGLRFIRSVSGLHASASGAETGIHSRTITLEASY